MTYGVAEIDERVKQLGARLGRHSPVRTRIDPSLIRRDLPPKEKRMPPTVTDTDRQRVLASLAGGLALRPAEISVALSLSIEVVKLALRDLLADDQVIAEGATRARRYSLPAQIGEAGHDQPADLGTLGAFDGHPSVAAARDFPPIADTPDLDDPDEAPAGEVFAGSRLRNVEISMTLPKIEYSGFHVAHPRIDRRYGQLLLDRIEKAEDLDVDLLDRVERLILLEIAGSPDAEALIERARTIGAIK